MVLSGALLAASCGQTVDVPTAPEVDEVLEAFETPTANVVGTVMAAVGDDLLELRTQIEESGLLEEILDVIVRVQVDLGAAPELGDLALQDGIGGFLNPTAVVQVNHRCRGWSSSATDAEGQDDGSLELTMVIEDGSINPVVWGRATQCRFTTEIGNRRNTTAYDGDISVHVGRVRDAVNDEIVAAFTFTLSGTLEVEALARPLERSFQLYGGGGLGVLVALESEESFVYFFDLGRFEQAVRDATGIFGCSLEERECIKASTGFSW